MYSITLHDGTELQNLELNGNNFIAPGVVEDAVFDGNLGTVTINDGTDAKTFTDMFLVCNRVEDGRSWIVLAEKSAEQKQQEAVDTAVTDLQLALAEVYELMIGGGSNG